jgi:hypothetical protein
LNESAVKIAAPFFLLPPSSFMKTPLLKSNLLINPSIVRVGCSAFLVLAAAVLTAASLLAPSTGAAADPTYLMPTGPGGCDSPSPRKVPVKIVNIKNNSGVPIYVVLETAKQDLLDQNNRQHDRWLQAEFQPTKGTYASTYLYRAYVNPQNGIRPNGGSVSVTVPFYTQLESKPCPNNPDQYINWWRALRIYVYDDPGAIKKAYDTDTNPANAVPISKFAPLAAPVPTCPACFAPLVVYRVQTGGDKHGVSLPAVDPSQLLEFTFATVDPFPKPLKIDYGFVDYDISSVDQVYLSVAMDPVNNPYIGFIGSVLGRDIFSDRLTKFRNDFSWPKYKWPAYVTNQTAIRLPGTFNVMNEIAHPGAPPPLVPAGAAIKALPVVQKMEKLWDECCGAAWPSKPCQRPPVSSNTCNKMAQVAELFEKNYANYKTKCKTPVKLDRDQMLARVYGWVPFNSCEPPPNGKVSNELKDTPGIGPGPTPTPKQRAARYHEISNAYVDLQYHSPPDPKTFGDFNRYTELIHSAKYLHVGEYAFSIDDAAGNMLELGDGVNITVGGAQGLDNINPYDPWRFFLFNVGSPKETGITWKKYRVCTALDAKDCSSLPPDRDMKESNRDKGFIGYAGIKIGAVPCPCVIVLEDSNKALYKVLVKRLPQPPPTHPINKEGEPPTANDKGWTAKSGDGFLNVECADRETSFEWCGQLQPNFDPAKQPSVYNVNTSAPVVFQPGIRFDTGNVKGTLSSDRLRVTVTWPKAITQPPGRPFKYELTLWNRANCPKDGRLPGDPCKGHAYNPGSGTCDSSKTECTVVFSKTVGVSGAPPLTANTLKSMSVVARDPNNPPKYSAQKEANFTATLAPPPDLGALRTANQKEIREDKKALKKLRHTDVPNENAVRRLLRMRLAVDKAQRLYPADEVLEQLDDMLDNRTTLDRAAKRQIREQLDARLAELQSGG